MPAPSNRFDPLPIGEFSHARPVEGRVRTYIPGYGPFVRLTRTRLSLEWRLDAQGDHRHDTERPPPYVGASPHRCSRFPPSVPPGRGVFVCPTTPWSDAYPM